MSGMTSDRLKELRRIAEAATPGPLTMHLCDDDRYTAFVDAPHLGPDAPELAVFLIERDARFFAEFDRDTVLAMLDEIERLRREREVLAEAFKHVLTCENCECASCPEGTDLSYRAYRAVSKSELLAGEEGADGVTHFALYHPDFNWWECQACRFLWEFENGNPYDDDMRFCPRCGRRIVRGRNKSTVITLKQRERH